MSVIKKSEKNLKHFFSLKFIFHSIKSNKSPIIKIKLIKDQLNMKIAIKN